MSKSGSSIAYGYNADGKRISKTVNGTTYNFSYLGDQLTEMTWGSNKLHFTYDSTGPASATYNGNRYFYLKNAQGDVTGLVNASGTQVVSYTYDPWGAPLSTDGTMASTLGTANPLRYRGYVYDTETGLYYLNSRYYNPTWGRFINADTAAVVAASPDKANWDKNLFAYCDNNPISRKDDGGDLWEEITTLGDSIFRSALIFGGLAIGAAVLSAFVVGTGGAGAIAIAATMGTIAEMSMYTAAFGALIGTMTVAIGEIGARMEVSSNKDNSRTADPPAKRKKYPSKKDAREAAKRDGKGEEPIHHPHGSHGPHYHPNIKGKYKRTPKGISKHDHYYYPKTR